MAIYLGANTKTSKKVDSFLEEIFEEKEKKEGSRIDVLDCNLFIVMRKTYYKKFIFTNKR